MDVILLNPLALFTNIFILLAIVWMFYDIIRDRETFLPALKKKWGLTIKIILFIVIAANWIWNIQKGL